MLQDTLTLLTFPSKIRIKAVMVETMTSLSPSYQAMATRSSTQPTWVGARVITARASPWIFQVMLMLRDGLSLLTFPPKIRFKEVTLVAMTPL